MMMMMVMMMMMTTMAITKKKTARGWGRVKTEEKLEYTPVVWWTPLARVFLGCLTVYDNPDVQIGYSTEYFYFLL